MSWAQGYRSGWLSLPGPTLDDVPDILDTHPVASRQDGQGICPWHGADSSDVVPGEFTAGAPPGYHVSHVLDLATGHDVCGFEARRVVTGVPAHRFSKDSPRGQLEGEAVNIDDLAASANLPVTAIVFGPSPLKTSGWHPYATGIQPLRGPGRSVSRHCDRVS